MKKRLSFLLLVLLCVGCGEYGKNSRSTSGRINQPSYVQIFNVPGGWHNIVEICDARGNLVIEGAGITVVPHGC